jgi:uncharacterized protein (DUF2147 family)
MKKNIFLALIPCFLLHFANAQTNGLEGKWLTKDHEIIEFYRSGDKIDGKLVGIAEQGDPGKRAAINAIIFTGLMPEGKKYVKGKYYDLESKKTYPVTIELTDNRTLKATFGYGLFSEVHVFTRV